MARKTTTTTALTDDLDGGRAHATVHFDFDGSSYEIDLSKANSRSFARMIALYVGHARRVGGNRPARSSTRFATRSTSAAKVPVVAKPKQDLAAIREWARGAGYEVSTRGRVAAAIVEAYEAAR